MRGQSSFVHEPDVAVYDGRIIGNAVYLKAFIRGDEGKDFYQHFYQQKTWMTTYLTRRAETMKSHKSEVP